jgi:hypothetical protein
VHRTVRWCTGQCPVRQAGSGKKAALGNSSAAYDYNSPDCPVVHRTVRWCTGLSGEPTVDCANGRPRNPRVTRGRANCLMGAPDCPVCTGQCPVRQWLQIFNGRLRQNRKAISIGQCPVVHRTVSGGAPDCPVRHSTEGKNCLPGLLSMAHGGEHQAYSKHS